MIIVYSSNSKFLFKHRAREITYTEIIRAYYNDGGLRGPSTITFIYQKQGGKPKKFHITGTTKTQNDFILNGLKQRGVNVDFRHKNYFA